jgi:signal transduction histidine kinase
MVQVHQAGELYYVPLWIAQIDTIFDAISDSLTVYDHEGRLQYANLAARKLFDITILTSYTLADPERARLLPMRSEAGKPLPQERWVLTRLLQGEQIPAERAERAIIRTPAGTQLIIQESGTPLSDADGHIVGAVLISNVIKPLPNTPAVQEIEQLKQEIQTLKEAEYLKDDFIATAAHELRTPLTALLGYAEMLSQPTANSGETPLAEWQIEALEAIAHDTRRVVGLTNDLLDVTQLQAHQLELQCYSANLVRLVQRVAARLQDTSKAHMLVIDTRTQQIFASIDTQRIEQVLTNLLSNAIKYTPQGGRILITIRADEEAGVARLSVRDQGIGIPPHQQWRIFSRFFRADNARTRGIEGTGLGLYLSRELVRLHGGKLWFESTEGQGTTFYLTLPLLSHSGEYC